MKTIGDIDDRKITIKILIDHFEKTIIGLDPNAPDYLQVKIDLLNLVVGYRKELNKLLRCEIEILKESGNV